MTKDSIAASVAADDKDAKDGSDAVPAKQHIAHPPADHLPEPGAAPGTAALLASQLQEGNKSLKLNDYTAARAHFKMAINVSPESVQAHAGLEKVTPPCPSPTCARARASDSRSPPNKRAPAFSSLCRPHWVFPPLHPIFVYNDMLTAELQRGNGSSFGHAWLKFFRVTSSALLCCALPRRAASDPSAVTALPLPCRLWTTSCTRNRRRLSWAAAHSLRCVPLALPPPLFKQAPIIIPNMPVLLLLARSSLPSAPRHAHGAAAVLPRHHNSMPRDYGRC